MDIINLGVKTADDLSPGEYIITDNRVAQVAHVSPNHYGQIVIRTIIFVGQDVPDVHIVRPGTLYRTLGTANGAGTAPQRRNGLAWNEEPFAISGGA
jgi:hypothetical protein